MDIVYQFVDNWNDYYLIPDYSYVISDKSVSYLSNLTPKPDPTSYVLKTTLHTISIYKSNLVVYYPFNKWRLPLKFKDDIVNSFKGVNIVSIEDVYGMASPEGSNKYNYSLSLKRAKSLADLFKDYSFNVKGLGECAITDKRFYSNCRKAYTNIIYSKADVRDSEKIVYSYDGITFFDENGVVVFSGNSNANNFNLLRDLIINSLENIKKIK